MRAQLLAALAVLSACCATARPDGPADSTGARFRITCQQPMTWDRRVTVSFDAAVDGRLSLFDMAGRLVGRRDVRAAGRGAVVWDLSLYAPASGAYILVAERPGRRQTRLLLILR